MDECPSIAGSLFWMWGCVVHRCNRCINHMVALDYGKVTRHTSCNFLVAPWTKAKYRAGMLAEVSDARIPSRARVLPQVCAEMHL